MRMEPQYHLLIIEDDPAVAHNLTYGLALEGYGVTWKANAHEGLEFAQEAHPHLILLDVRLPDSSGFDVCRQMRQNGLRQPIIMLTVQRDEVDKILGLELGADDYMTKPFSLRELLSRVRAQLRRAYGEFAAAEGTTLYAGDLIIDLKRGQVRRGTEIINVTPTEFRLLVYLVHNAGQALTREQILEAVWDYGADLEDEKTVNTNIRRLRGKIEINPSQPALILTVPGIGYRFTG